MALASPPEPAPTRGLRPGLLAAGAGVLVLAGMHAFADVVNLVALSALATILLAPVQSALRARGWPGWAAFLSCLALYIGVLAIGGLLLLVGITGFLRDLPQYEAVLAGRLEDLGAVLGGPGSPPPADAEAIADFARGLASDLVGGLAALGYSVFVVAYLLLEAPRATERMRWAFGPATSAVARGSALADRLRTYIVARAVLGGIAAILDVVLLVILGVPAALLWGLLSFLLSFVPNIGFIVALIPPTILGLAIGGPVTALLVIVGYSVINIAIDYVIQPRFVGGRVDLSPVVITVCLLFWGVVLGGAGALLAVPLTIAAAALFDAFDDTRPLSRLLGDRVAAG